MQKHLPKVCLSLHRLVCLGYMLECYLTLGIIVVGLVSDFQGHRRKSGVL